jgi:hypothetical protein
MVYWTNWAIRWSMHLSLKHFILRQQVILLYRQIIRASRGMHNPHKHAPKYLIILVIPDSGARKETIAFFRSEFDRIKYLTDVVRI